MRRVKKKEHTFEARQITQFTLYKDYQIPHDRFFLLDWGIALKNLQSHDNTKNLGSGTLYDYPLSSILGDFVPSFLYS